MCDICFRSLALDLSSGAPQDPVVTLTALGLLIFRFCCQVLVSFDIYVHLAQTVLQYLISADVTSCVNLGVVTANKMHLIRKYCK